MSFLNFLYDHNPSRKSIITSIIKYDNLLGCSQNQILFINTLRKPLTKYVTGFKCKKVLSHGIAIVSGFHNIPDSQNTAVINDFTKFTKSLLIAPINDANCAHKVKNMNDSNK